MSKKWITIASTLIVVGFLGLLFTRFDISNENYSPFEHEWEYENTEVNSLDITGSSTNIDIQFMTSNTNNTVITIKGEVESQILDQIMKASLIDGKFTLDTDGERQMRWLSFGIEKNNITMIVALPAGKTLSHMQLVTSSGRAKIANLIAMSANINSSSGNLQIINSKVEHLIASSSSGHMRYAEHSGNIEANLKSGNIKINQLKGNSNITTTSGKIEVEQISEGNMTIKATSGNVHATQHLSGNANIETTSGNVKVKVGEKFGGEIHSRSNSGNISGLDYARDREGVIPTQHKINLKTTSGNIKLLP